MTSRIHITGASGSGTTTLGRRLAAAIGSSHLDSDDYFWEPTDPPYRKARSREQRLHLLKADLDSQAGWVLSGSISGWGDEVTSSLFDLVIFVVTPTPVRIERLRKRETERFGSEVLAPGGVMHEQHAAFVEWASGYDDGDESTRSRRQHEKWLAKLEAPVLRVRGDDRLDALVSQVLDELARLAPTERADVAIESHEPSSG